MLINENNLYPSFQSVRPSFWKVYETVKENTELECVCDTKTGKILPLGIELCKIITEVLLLNPENEIKISGEMLPVSLVQEIFRQIYAEHLIMVIENYSNVATKIKNKKSYLRTALYNSFFELEASEENYTNVCLNKKQNPDKETITRGFFINKEAE